MSLGKRKRVRWADQVPAEEDHTAGQLDTSAGTEQSAPDAPELANSTGDIMMDQGEVYSSVLERDVEAFPSLGQ